MDAAILEQERLRVEFQNKRASALGLAATLTFEQWIKTLDHFQWTCAYCAGPYEVLEHFIPLILQGETSVSNCLPACFRCNARKLGMHPGSLSWLAPSTLLYIRSYFLTRDQGEDEPSPPVHLNNEIREITEDSDVYLRMQDVMDWLRISDGVLRGLVMRGQIRALKFENHLRFEREEIHRYLRANVRRDGKGTKKKRA